MRIFEDTTIVKTPTKILRFKNNEEKSKTNQTKTKKIVIYY
jgi:hypothetical protein